MALGEAELCPVGRVGAVDIKGSSDSRKTGADGHLTLERLLRHATRREPMTGEASFRCQRCDGHRPALRRTLLRRLPEVLVLHVGRARWKARGSRTKLQQHVEFPLDGLCPASAGCLSPDAYCGRSFTEQLFTQPALARRLITGSTVDMGGAVAGDSTWGHSRGEPTSLPRTQTRRSLASSAASDPSSGLTAGRDSALTASDAVYDAVGVVRHRGRGIDTGHYVAYRRDGGLGGEWLLADDRSVRAVSRAEVEAVQAFIIVYQRRKHCIGH